jgi:predicted amidophosphoribosyltransferase
MAGIIGLILIVVGSVTGGKKKEEPSQEELNVSLLQQPNTNNKIYCRHCGKQRPTTGLYCPSCGRSTSTLVDDRNNMKQCMYCKSLLSDSSLFCSNCGRRFSQESSFVSTSSQITDEVFKAPVSNIPHSGELYICTLHPPTYWD